MSIFEGLKPKRDNDAKIGLLKTFYTKGNVDFKTDLTHDEIVGLSTLESVENYLKEDFKIDIGTKFFTDKLKAQKVSQDRKGRGEMVEVLKEQTLTDQEKVRKGILGMIGVK